MLDNKISIKNDFHLISNECLFRISSKDRKYEKTYTSIKESEGEKNLSNHSKHGKFSLPSEIFIFNSTLFVRQSKIKK